MDQLDPLSLVGVLLLASGALVAAMVFGKKAVSRMPAMLPVPVQSFFLYCMFFTIGIALLGIGGSFLLPLGTALVALGLSFFLPEAWAARLLGSFLILLGLSLLALLQYVTGSEALIRPRQGLSDRRAEAVLFLWGICVLFAWRRWSSVRLAPGKATGLPPLIETGKKEPNHKSEPTSPGRGGSL
jgi:hypothetical protein